MTANNLYRYENGNNNSNNKLLKEETFIVLITQLY